MSTKIKEKVIVVVDILTTDGLNFSAKSAKLSGALFAYATLNENSKSNIPLIKVY